jgi:hypothetical protein
MMHSKIDELKSFQTRDELDYRQINQMMKKLRGFKDYEQLLWYMNNNLDQKQIIERALLANYVENHFEKEKLEDISIETYDHNNVIEATIFARVQNTDEERTKWLRSRIEELVQEKIKRKQQVLLSFSQNLTS